MDDIVEVVVKEAVYQELEKRGMDPLEHLVEVESGAGDYGNYGGRVLHLTSENGQVPCGSFQVLVIRGEDFPEAHQVALEWTGDQVLKVREEFSGLRAAMDDLREAA